MTYQKLDGQKVLEFPTLCCALKEASYAPKRKCWWRMCHGHIAHGNRNKTMVGMGMGMGMSMAVMAEMEMLEKGLAFEASD